VAQVIKHQPGKPETLTSNSSTTNQSINSKTFILANHKFLKCGGVKGQVQHAVSTKFQKECLTVHIPRVSVRENSIKSLIQMRACGTHHNPSTEA
jgi:hypothetical protein